MSIPRFITFGCKTQRKKKKQKLYNFVCVVVGIVQLIFVIFYSGNTSSNA